MTTRQRRNMRRGKKLTGAIVLLGGLGDTPDFRYASGFSTVDPCVYVQSSAGKWLIVPLLEKGRAQNEAHKGIGVLTPAELGLKKAKQRRLSSWIEGVAHQHGFRSLLVSPWCPAGIVEKLRAGGFRIRVSSKPLFPGREIKQQGEIAAIIHAQRAAVHGLRAAVRLLKSARPGKNGWLTVKGRRITADDVRHVIDRALIERDCISSGTIVACGAQGADPHERGHGALRAGQPIVLDIFPQHRSSGYWGDLSRTVVRGRASGEVKRMFTAVKEAHAAALQKVKHGVSVRCVHEAAKRIFESSGFPTRINNGRPEGFIHSAGHGVGLAIHEAPAVGPVGGILQSGHVITIEPGLYYGDVGGMRIEDTVLVTGNGYQILCKAPLQLEI